MPSVQPTESSPVRGVVDALSQAGLPEKSIASYQSFLEADYPKVNKIKAEIGILAEGISYLEGVISEVPEDPKLFASVASWAFVQSRSVNPKTHQDFHQQTHTAMLEAMSGDEGVLILEESAEELGHQFDEASVWLESREGETLFSQALGGFSQILADGIERSQDASGVPDGVSIIDEAAVDWIAENCQDLVDYLKAVSLLFLVDDEEEWETPPVLQESLDAFLEDLG